MIDDSPVDVAIVGGGIAGLAIAYYLQQQGQGDGQPVRLAILEQDGRPGGKLLTEQTGGFVIEGGADSFPAAGGEVLALCAALGIDDQVIAAAESAETRYILSGGKLVPLPDGIQGLVPADLAALARNSLLSARGRLRAARELTLPAGTTAQDESMAVFVRRRFGQEAVDKLAYPLLAITYLGDPEWLSMRATFPEYLEMEVRHGSLIRGRRAESRAGADAALSGSAPASRAVRMSLRDGLGILAEALAGRLTPASLRLNHAVTHVRRPFRPGEPYRLETREGRIVAARSVILAVSAPVAAGLLGDAASDLAAELRQIRYLSCATVAIGYRPGEVTVPFGGAGFARAANESSPLLAASWTSTRFPAHAPPGAALLRAVVGGDKGTPAMDLPDGELSTLVRAELGRVLGVTALPAVSRVYRWRLGNPQYDTGHLARVARLDAFAAALPGLFLAGSAYRGIDIAANIREARALAPAVSAHLDAERLHPPGLPIILG